jgi:hypothetical protein
VHRAAPAVSSGGSWVRIGVMNVPRMFHTATLLPAAGGPLNRTRQVLVTGGPDPGNEVSTGQTSEVFDLASSSWTLTGNMKSIRTGHTAALLASGRVLLAGGLGGSSEVQPIRPRRPRLAQNVTQLPRSLFHQHKRWTSGKFMPVPNSTTQIFCRRYETRGTHC